jgi:hypothetical protein
VTPERAAQILSLERPWTPLAIKKAYRRRSRETHPDRGGSDEAFKEVAEARQTLEDYLEHGRPVDLGPMPSDGPSNATWDAWEATAGWEDEDEDEDIPLSAWFEVLSVRLVGGPWIDMGFRAQLVELEQKTLNKYGEAIRLHYLIAVYPDRPVELRGQMVEVVLREGEGHPPSAFVRRISQRSLERDGRVNAFWFDPLDEPVVHEENVHSHGRYNPPEEW